MKDVQDMDFSIVEIVDGHMAVPAGSPLDDEHSANPGAH
jgi:hypothetical protein